MVKRHAALFAGRLLFYLAGQLILCAGIILNTKTGLGVAPINSLPYLVSEITPITLGQATSILYLLCITAQCLIRRRLSLQILLQFPFSYVFGLLIDLFNHLLDVVQPSNLLWALFWLAAASWVLTSSSSRTFTSSILSWFSCTWTILSTRPLEDRLETPP